MEVDKKDGSKSQQPQVATESAPTPTSGDNTPLQGHVNEAAAKAAEFSKSKRRGGKRKKSEPKKPPQG